MTNGPACSRWAEPSCLKPPRWLTMKIESRVLRLGIAAAILVGGCSKEKPQPEIQQQREEVPQAVEVTLTPAAAQEVKLEIVPVAAIPAGMTGPGIEAPGRVEGDPSRMALVSSRAAGRLERLVAVIGDRVETNQVVAWVQ